MKNLHRLTIALASCMLAATAWAGYADDRAEIENVSNKYMVAVDAGRGAHYVQSFTAGANATGEPLLLTSEEAGRSIGRQGAIVVGTGAMAVAELAKDRVAEPRFPDLQPHARSLALLAPSLVPVSPVKPLYLRQADARPQDAAAPARAQS